MWFSGFRNLLLVLFGFVVFNFVCLFVFCVFLFFAFFLLSEGLNLGLTKNIYKRNNSTSNHILVMKT